MMKNESTLPAVQESGGASGAEATERKFGTGRSGLVIPGLLLVIGTYLFVGIVNMQVPDGAKAPGPKFFPILITIAIYVLAALLVIQLLRKPEPAPADRVAYRSYTDWKTVAKIVLGFLIFALLLVPVGWLICAAFLFWIVSHALGSKRALGDVGVAVVFSSCIQLAFGAGLGLNLPSGILEGLIG